MSSRRLTLAKAGIRISRMRLLRLGFLHGRFLGYAMLGLAEFLLNLGDFVVLDVGGEGMTPFGVGFLPLGGGKVIAAEPGVDVPEVGMVSGVMAVTLHSLGQSSFGLAEVVLLVIDPAHAIEVGALLGFF